MEEVDDTCSMYKQKKAKVNTNTGKSGFFFFFFPSLEKKKDNKLDYRLEKGLDVTAEAILLNTNMDAKIETKMV